MTSIVGFNVTINTMCSAGTKECHLAYTYNVLWDEAVPANSEEFTVRALLWGGRSFNHSHIYADLENDVHKISRGTPMPMTRKITVNCDHLDRFWGDNILMKLEFTPDSGEDIRYEALSSTNMEEEIATPAMVPKEVAAA